RRLSSAPRVGAAASASSGVTHNWRLCSLLSSTERSTEDEGMERRSVTNIARFTIAAMVLLTGCATIRRLQARDTEELLTAAGFKKQLADAADTKPTDATPPYRLVSRTKDGTVQYTYADPDDCRCVYVGGSKEYAEYQRLATERRLDDERRRAAEDVGERNSWG